MLPRDQVILSVKEQGHNTPSKQLNSFNTANLVSPSKSKETNGDVTGYIEYNKQTRSH